MSATTSTIGAPGVTPSAPSMTLNVTEPAVVEIKKFMTGEEGLPETACARGARWLLGISIQPEHRRGIAPG